MGFFDPGKKHAVLSLFTFCVLISCLSAEIEKMRYDSPLVVEEIHVGVILDMKSREGRIVLSCISAAVSDFYQLHKNYSTRVVLHSRDSKGEPLHALSAGEPFFITSHIYLICFLGFYLLFIFGYIGLFL